MPSSISSSDSRPERRPPRHGGRAWLLALGLVLALLAGFELGGRGLGFSPSVQDSLDLWSYHRARVYEGGRRSLVLVGASSLALDLDTGELRRRLPGWQVTQLAVAARAPAATLLDLCADPDFKGHLLVSLRPEYLAPRYWGQQAGYVDHYHHQWDWWWGPMVRLRSLLQERLLFLDANLNLVFFYDSLARWLKTGRPPPPFWVTTEADRSQWARFTPRVIQRRLAAWRAGQDPNQGSLAGDPDFYRAWLGNLDRVAKGLENLRNRGGRAAVVFPPLGLEHLAVARRVYPRERFWDLMARRLGPPAVYCPGDPALAAYIPPDGTHLDWAQAPGFTRLLARRLERAGFLPGPDSPRP